MRRVWGWVLLVVLIGLAVWYPFYLTPERAVWANLGSGAMHLGAMATVLFGSRWVMTRGVETQGEEE